MSDRLLTAAEVAELLVVSERWVREHTRLGEIPCVKLGRHRRYSPEAITAWIEARSVEARGRKSGRSA